MKTPKEEAESLALKTSTGLFSKDRLNSSQVVKVTDAILDTIPLAELIAVARAADVYVRRGNLEDFKSLHNAIEALHEWERWKPL
jgi:hypothetical protein